MNAKGLVGKNAIRTQPIYEMVEGSVFSGFGGGLQKRALYGFTTEPVKILKATDSHIVYESKSFSNKETYTRVLDCRYCDDNWIDYDELMNLESTQGGETECMTS